MHINLASYFLWKHGAKKIRGVGAMRIGTSSLTTPSFTKKLVATGIEQPLGIVGLGSSNGVSSLSNLS
jgi:hypothetical protein